MGPKNNQTDDNVEENVGNILMQEKKIKKKRSHQEKFLSDVISGAESYRRSYRNLKNRQRNERVEEIAKNVMSACINREDAVKNGENYLKNNKDLQIDVLTFLGEFMNL